MDNIISNFPYGNRLDATDGRILHERVEHCLGLVRRKLVLILPMTFWESRPRHAFFRRYPPVWWAPCSDRPSMPPGTIEGPRDHNGAIIQPPAAAVPRLTAGSDGSRASAGKRTSDFSA